MRNIGASRFGREVVIRPAGMQALPVATVPAGHAGAEAVSSVAANDGTDAQIARTANAAKANFTTRPNNALVRLHQLSDPLNATPLSPSCDDAQPCQSCHRLNAA